MVRQHLEPVRPLVAAVDARDRQLDQAELGAGVVDHHQQAATVGPALVVQVVFAAFLPRLYDDGGAPRIGRGHQAHLGRVAAVGAEDHVLGAAGDVDLELEVPVELVPDDLVTVLGRAHHVAVYLVGAPRLVDGRVEEAVAVGRPGDPVAGAEELVGEVLAGGQVAHPQREDLPAVVVDGVGQQPAVRAHLADPEVEVVVPLGELVLVQQQLLRPVRVSGGRADVHAILLARAAPDPVVERPVPPRSRDVVVRQHTRELVEDHLPQVGSVSGALGRPVVLRSQVVRQLGGVDPAHPRIAVADLLAVQGAGRAVAGRARRSVHGTTLDDLCQSFRIVIDPY